MHNIASECNQSLRAIPMPFLDHSWHSQHLTELVNTPNPLIVVSCGLISHMMPRNNLQHSKTHTFESFWHAARSSSCLEVRTVRIGLEKQSQLLTGLFGEPGNSPNRPWGQKQCSLLWTIVLARLGLNRPQTAARRRPPFRPPRLGRVDSW